MVSGEILVPMLIYCFCVCFSLALSRFSSFVRYCQPCQCDNTKWKQRSNHAKSQRNIARRTNRMRAEKKKPTKQLTIVYHGVHPCRLSCLFVCVKREQPEHTSLFRPQIEREKKNYFRFAHCKTNKSEFRASHVVVDVHIFFFSTLSALFVRLLLLLLLWAALSFTSVQRSCEQVKVPGALTVAVCTYAALTEYSHTLPVFWNEMECRRHTCFTRNKIT